VEGRTENLSSQGFYCIAKEPFVVGERLECEVEFPPQWGSTDAETAVFLHCVAHVVRVEANHLQDGFGIACRIEEYALRWSGPYSLVGLPATSASELNR
jgi:hypothetical protein